MMHAVSARLCAANEPRSASSACVVLAHCCVWIACFCPPLLLGIFMDERVTDFPYTWFDDPMYTFTSIYFIASAVADLSATGLIIALEVAFVYWITCKVEGPYTAAIYEQRAREKAAQIKPASEDEVATAKKPEAPSDDANIKQRKTNSSTSN